MRARDRAAPPLLLLVLLAPLAGCRTEAPVVDALPTESERMISVEGVDVHYFDFRPWAPGPPLLFLHGYSGCGYEAYFFQDDLGPRRVIAPDLPGHGKSGKPDIDYDLGYYLEFLRGFMQALRLDHVVLVGHSMGGKIAAAYAALDGSSVDRLILIAPYGLDGEVGDFIGALSNTGELVDISFNLHSQALMDLVLRLEIFHDHTRIPQDLVDYISDATFFSENGIGALANITRNTIARNPIDELLPQILVPTLIIWGENDRLLKFRYAAEFHGLIAGSTLVSIGECGHMPHVEQQEATADAIQSFLGSGSLSPAAASP